MPKKFPTTRARKVQEKIATRLVEEDTFLNPPRTICGLDVSYYGNTAIGVSVLLNFPDLELIEHQVAYTKSTIPYIPTFLSFREYSPLSLAYTALTKKPDLCFLDAHGRAHPRKLGAASHFGILRNVPTIGVAKKLLCGIIRRDSKPFDSIIFDNAIIGARVTSKPGCNPIYISVGHRISLMKAIELTQKCITRYRLPEPTRLAHRLATEARRKLKEKG
ncbi:MAG: deoxyribonuclease V [Candidatus Thorarchaeota archaeon]